MIDRLGFRPRFDRCVVCGKDLGESLVYSSMLGGALCADCRDRATDSVPFTKELVLALDQLLSSDPESEAKSALDRQVAQIVEATLLSHVGDRLPSEGFWRSVNRNRILAG
jgi:recombinational DNA repair protein (RecF pathway)